MTEPGPSPVLWINGFPGTGKLTIAKELTRIYKPSILIDNHQRIDPVAAIFSRDHPQYQIERKRQREWAFENFVREPTRLAEAVIFTDFQSDNELGTDTAQEYCDAAQKVGRPFIPVYLACKIEANIMRATSAERTRGTTTKLTCPDTFRSLYISDTPTTIGRGRLKIQFGEQYELQSLACNDISTINFIANFAENNFSLHTIFQPRGSLLFNGGIGGFFWGTDFNKDGLVLQPIP
ncbi:hypothetical protein MKX08_000773 [Trichoderma sp. CBMAI-0020]|nr:hypothetical protein MKX08_000773 [Trichoderma sp. CBMAI-0020]